MSLSPEPPSPLFLLLLFEHQWLPRINSGCTTPQVHQNLLPPGSCVKPSASAFQVLGWFQFNLFSFMHHLAQHMGPGFPSIKSFNQAFGTVTEAWYYRPGDRTELWSCTVIHWRTLNSVPSLDNTICGALWMSPVRTFCNCLVTSILFLVRIYHALKVLNLTIWNQAHEGDSSIWEANLATAWDSIANKQTERK